MTLAHHLGEGTLAAALVSGAAVLPATLLVVRARVDNIRRARRRRRSAA